jgi:hypothetical protein
MFSDKPLNHASNKDRLGVTFQMDPNKPSVIGPEREEEQLYHHYGNGAEEVLRHPASEHCRFPSGLAEEVCQDSGL